MKLHSEILGNLPFFSMLAISIYIIYPISRMKLLYSLLLLKLV